MRMSSRNATRWWQHLNPFAWRSWVYHGLGEYDVQISKNGLFGKRELRAIHKEGG